MLFEKSHAYFALVCYDATTSSVMQLMPGMSCPF